MGRILAVVPFVAVLLAAPAHADDSQYIADMTARNIPTGLNGTMGAKLGHTVCIDLRAGQQASDIAATFAGLEISGADEFTTAQTEEIVYWAITDICPTYSAQLQDRWKG